MVHKLIQGTNSIKYLMQKKYWAVSAKLTRMYLIKKIKTYGVEQYCSKIKNNLNFI